MKQITTLLLLCSLQAQRPCDHYHRGADCFSHWELRSRSLKAEVVLSPGQLEKHSIKRSSAKTIKHDLYQNEDLDPPTGRKKRRKQFFSLGIGFEVAESRSCFVLSTPSTAARLFNIQFDPFNQVQSNLDPLFHFDCTELCTLKYQCHGFLYIAMITSFAPLKVYNNKKSIILIQESDYILQNW